MPRRYSAELTADRNHPLFPTRMWRPRSSRRERAAKETWQPHFSQERLCDLILWPPRFRITPRVGVVLAFSGVVLHRKFTRLLVWSMAESCCHPNLGL